MKRKLKIIINENGEQKKVLDIHRLLVPPVLVRWIYGKRAALLLLSPGETIGGIEICEQHCGGELDE